MTRARRELLVFATLRPEQIDLGRTNAKGVIDFKHFLEFAENGARAIAEAFSPSGRGTESPFEDAVMLALEDKGWVVHPQIGVSFFRIDLGVVHPDFPGRYLAGVECDGAAYHRSATARDRDRLREMVLTDLGWRIRRIWSTEWWMDATTAMEKLDARLTADLEADRASRTAPVVEPDTEVVVPTDDIDGGDTELPAAPQPSNRPQLTSGRGRRRSRPTTAMRSKNPGNTPGGRKQATRAARLCWPPLTLRPIPKMPPAPTAKISTSPPTADSCDAWSIT